MFAVTEEEFFRLNYYVSTLFYKSQSTTFYKVYPFYVEGEYKQKKKLFSELNKLWCEAQQIPPPAAT